MSAGIFSKIAAPFRRQAPEKKHRKPRGPQVNGRQSETESFLMKIAQRCRRRAEAHRLVAPKPEDHRALQSLLAVATAAEEKARNLRDPELPLA